jgi:hypothetical protein
MTLSTTGHTLPYYGKYLVKHRKKPPYKKDG